MLIEICVHRKSSDIPLYSIHFVALPVYFKSSVFTVPVNIEMLCRMGIIMVIR
jgi:hypothetical protein